MRKTQPTAPAEEIPCVFSVAILAVSVRDHLADLLFRPTFQTDSVCGLAAAYIHADPAESKQTVYLFGRAFCFISTQRKDGILNDLDTAAHPVLKEMESLQIENILTFLLTFFVLYGYICS